MLENSSVLKSEQSKKLEREKVASSLVVQACETSDDDDVLSIEQYNQNFLHIPAVHSYTNKVQPGSFSPSFLSWQRFYLTVTNAPVIETGACF